RSGAQGTIGLGVTDSPDPVFVNGTLTYTISVTNLLGDFANILVTNAWSASVSFLSANRAVSFTNDNVITFNLGTLASGEIALIILTAQPNAAGFITNVVTAFDTTFGACANASAGTQVSSAPRWRWRRRRTSYRTP